MFLLKFFFVHAVIAVAAKKKKRKENNESEVDETLDKNDDKTEKIKKMKLRLDARNGRFHENYEKDNNFQQRLRLVGMSYGRTLFHKAFLYHMMEDEMVDVEYIQNSFSSTHSLLFDDAYIFREKNSDEKLLLFLHEIHYDILHDKTLSVSQREEFRAWFKTFHQSYRSHFIWAIFLLGISWTITMIIWWIFKEIIKIPIFVVCFGAIYAVFLVFYLSMNCVCCHCITRIRRSMFKHKIKINPKNLLY